MRIIQSIPSSKAEPLKRWLAKVGYERVQEIEDPELATKRTRALYKAKGYSEAWIEKRMRGIVIREELTDEWRNRGVQGLERENLRDHMDDLELIFSMLGEKVTTEISKNETPKTFPENKKVAKRGGSVAGTARAATEKELGRSIVSKENYLKKPQDKKLLGDQGIF